eukprot:scaffold58917_cov62-Attheya_sp.AAC.6
MSLRVRVLGKQCVLTQAVLAGSPHYMRIVVGFILCCELSELYTGLSWHAIRLPCKPFQAKSVFKLNSMDVKRPLLTQVPSQTDDTTTVQAVSSRIGLRIEFDGCEEATFDPSSVSNGCWDQKLARVAGMVWWWMLALSSYWYHLEHW